MTAQPSDYPYQSKNVRRFAALVIAAILAQGTIGAAPAAAESMDKSPRKLNVLLITVDDLRPALGCYGDNIAITPNIDRLANRGALFNRAYCQQAVCCPSRLSMLTGRRPDTIRVWDNSTHFRSACPDIETLPQYFKRHGYHAQSIGKIFHGSGKPSKDPPSWSVKPQYDVVRGALRYVLPDNLQNNRLKQSATESADVPDNAYVDGVICEKALDTLAELKSKDSPFFLAVGFYKPHLPFCAPRKYWDLYERSEIPKPTVPSYPENAPEFAVRSFYELEGYTDMPEDGRLSPEQIQTLRYGYYACVSYADAMIGRLLDGLAEQGLADNTVVVLLGDHGFHLGERQLWAKCTNYELATRAPLIVALPGQTNAGVKVDALVEFVDIYPTLAEVCGLEMPADMEGISLKPLLANPQRPWKQAAFSQFPRAYEAPRHRDHGDVMGYAVRTDDFRFVQWRDWKSQEVLKRELYDHRNDPHETNNVALLPEYEATVAQLEQTLRDGWRAALPATDPATAIDQTTHIQGQPR